MCEYIFSIQHMRALTHHSEILHPFPRTHLSSNGDLDLNTSLDVDNDLLNDLGGGIKATPISSLPSHSLQARGGTYSMRRLWILISKQSQVLEPSPQGVLRVVTLRTLVGRRTGPLTRRFLFLARSIRSVVTTHHLSARGCRGGGEGGGEDGPFSRAPTLREVRVIRIRWILGPSPNSPFSGLL